MEIKIPPVSEIVKLLWSIGRRIGSIKNLKRNMVDLDKNATPLFKQLCDVQDIMNNTELEVATAECRYWIDYVEMVKCEVVSINSKREEDKKCLAWCCPNVKSMMELGKHIEDMIQEMKNLTNRRLAFAGWEFHDALLERVEPQIVEINSSTDSEPRLQKILGLIEDDSIQKIGIWGTGGIGKTRTLKLLNNRLEESHMFDIVIWVTVSAEGSRRKVQNDIAERLKCTAMEMSDDRLRANIYHRLSGKKFLLILDDIWEIIDLAAVGIPILNQDNGCKVLLTTRDFGICQQMETDVQIQMERLSKEEAWSLFHEKVGDVAMSPRIEPIARDIVTECGGLPLAIIVIGSSLRENSDAAVWRNALKELQLPSTSQIEGLEKELMFSRLRINYDRLLNDCERNLFLYCSLYPEDWKILIAELAEYCWLEGYIQGVNSIEEARDLGHHMVMKLVDASLLDRCDNEEHVKMHDTIRGFALKEASGFLVKAGKHVEESLQSQKISLMQCSLDSLRELERLNCSNLSTLLLQDNYQLTMIPDSFFECMHSLSILDLSRTEIKSLPSSLWNLVNLRGLYLRGCRKLEELPPQVGALKQLEVLHLGGSTAIKYLPREVGELTRLKCLVVGFKNRNYSKKTEEWNMKLRVPTGIIPKLPLLEELSLYVYDLVRECVEKEQWDNKSMKVVVDEMCRLKHLKYLDAYFPKVKSLNHFLRHSKSLKASWFRRFDFRVGTEKSKWDHFLPNYRVYRRERCLVYKGGLGMSQAAIMKTLAHCSFFRLQDHRTARKLSELGLTNLNDLKECRIIGCDKMKTLVDGHSSALLLPILEILEIRNLPEFRSLCDCPLLPGSLSKLRVLHLLNCKNLKKVFQLGIIRELCSLEELWVQDCLMVEEIMEIEEEEMSVASDRLILPNIKEINLSYLPELVSICRGFSNFEWPSLETIEIDRCLNLKSLSFLSNGTALKKISGSSSWWEALVWEDIDIKQRLQHFFVNRLIGRW